SSRRRQLRWPFRRLAGQSLKDPRSSARERERNSRKISDPNAILLLADQSDGAITLRGQTLAPEPAGARIMQAPTFHVVHLEARALHRSYRVPDIVELTAWENVLGQRALLGPHPASAP